MLVVNFSHEDAGGRKTDQELGLYLVVFFFALAPWTAPLLVWRETEWFHTLTTPGRRHFFGSSVQEDWLLLNSPFMEDT